MSVRSRTLSLVREASTPSTPRIALLPRAAAAFSTSGRRSRISRRDERHAMLASAIPRTASTSYVPPPPPPITTSSRSDDDLLKAHFDLAFPVSSSQSSPSGLFLLPTLSSPAALQPLTDRTLIHAQALVKRICAAPSDPTGKELRLVVKNLDRLSDLLCGVIDMCELVRNVHPDEVWVVESEKAYERLCSFMNGLNTDQGLYRVRGLHPHPLEAG